MRKRESAICLRTTDYSETSQVVHFFTRGEGLVHLLAKGAKRPKSSSLGAIDLLSEGELVFISKASGALGTLVEFSQTISRSPLRADAARLNAALYMIELAGELFAEADPHVEAFDLLHNGLARLEQADAPVAGVLAYFQWRLLRHAGLLGEFNCCVCCSRDVRGTSGRKGQELYFSSGLGGVLCPLCEGAVAEKRRLDGTTMAGLAVLAAAEAGRKVVLSNTQADCVNRMLSYHIREQLGRSLKMARHAIG